MTVTDVAFLLAGVTLAVFIFISWLDHIENKAKNTWEVVVEGVYVEKISKFTDAKTSTRMTGGYAKLPPMIWDTLVFKDGTRIKVINIGKLPPSGTYSKVIKNGRADFKIETA